MIDLDNIVIHMQMAITIASITSIKGTNQQEHKNQTIFQIKIQIVILFPSQAGWPITVPNLKLPQIHHNVITITILINSNKNSHIIITNKNHIKQ